MVTVRGHLPEAERLSPYEAAALADLHEADRRLASGDDSPDALTAFWNAFASLDLVGFCDDR